MQRYRHWLLACLLLSGLLVTHAHATIKVLVEVKNITFDGTTIACDLVLTPTGLPVLATRKTFAATSISDPATIAASIKTMVIAFALSQYSATIVASEILLVGAPE